MFDRVLKMLMGFAQKLFDKIMQFFLLVHYRDNLDWDEIMI